MSDSEGEAPAPIAAPTAPPPVEDGAIQESGIPENPAREGAVPDSAVQENAVQENAVDERATPVAAESVAPDAFSDLRLFFGPNAEKFLALVARGKAGRMFAGLCWPGFFLPPAWFLYRKLYGWAALCCLLPILSAVLNFGQFGRLFVVAPSILGLLGKRIYVAAARTTVAQIRTAAESEEAARETIRRAGGVSIPGAVVGGLLTSLSFIVAFVVGFQSGFNAIHPLLH